MKPHMRLVVAVLGFLLLSSGALAQKNQPSKNTAAQQDVPASPKRTVINKDFARLLMEAVEAIASKDGSNDAEHRADAAKAKALAEAEMEMDDTVRENEKLSVTFGLTLVSMTHRTYELSGAQSDRQKFDACAASYKNAIRKATITEQTGDKITPVLADCPAK